MNQQDTPLQNVKIEFIYSAALEAVSSMHILSEPAHHPNCVDWYDTALSQIDTALLTQISHFGHKYALWHFVMDVVDYVVATPDHSRCDIVDDFDTVISEIRQMPDDLFAYIFLGETLLGEEISQENILTDDIVIRKYDTLEVKEYITFDNVEYFLQNMEIVRNEMLEIMTAYYECFFRDHWKRNCAAYRNKIRTEIKLCTDLTALDYILQLHEDLSLQDDNLMMKKEVLFQLKIGKIRTLRIICSAYTYPHLMMNIYKDTLSLYKNLFVPNFSIAINEIAESAKLFCDPTRLAIVKLLINTSMTPSELAAIFDISPASISQHLKILKDAGIVTSHRDKKHVIYIAEPKKIAQTLSALGDFLKAKVM